MKTFRLIQSPAASASRNMTLDEQIFKRYLEDGIPTLRVYTWKSPSFTYGVSQDPTQELDLAACASDNVEVAQRMTGGGILFHHDEITYSFVCGKQDLGEPQGIFVAYRRICAFLIWFYKSFGISASYALDAKDFTRKSVPHELCSASHEKYDIVIDGKKIGGNAQKRARQAVFQHGSIPCSIDWGFVRKYAGNLPQDIEHSVTTLAHELGTIPPKESLAQELISAFGNEFGVQFQEEDQSVYETSVA